MSNPYRVKEVCQIVAKDNPDLRGKGGFWCIVSQVNEFSCTVVAWDGLYTVRQEHLKSLEYSDDDCARMREICVDAERLVARHRITKLRNIGKLEEAAVANKGALG